jgi:type VI secretion system protein VasD
MMDRVLSVCLVTVLVAGAAACSKPAPPAVAVPGAAPAPAPAPAPPPEPPRQASITIAHDAKGNPDGEGRPSPVHVRVYQLSRDVPFKTVMYFDAKVERDVLGETLLGREERFLKNGEQATIALTLAREASFVGVVAELRDIRNAEWRALVPAQAGAVSLAISTAGIATVR